jgi:dephospho-CoA kinase
MASLRIGLTGGIGSGKSTVAGMLAKRGAAIIDTDRIARDLTTGGGSAIGAIRTAFGAGFIDPDGGLDRPRMRQLVFADDSARRRLEAILHPLIGSEADRLAEAASGAPLHVFDIPLLVESGRWRSRVDRVWLVDCPEFLQVDRVVSRSGWSPDAVRAVIARQAGRPARRAAADAVISNQGLSLEELDRDVDILMQWTKAAQ